MGFLFCCKKKNKKKFNLNENNIPYHENIKTNINFKDGKDMSNNTQNFKVEIKEVKDIKNNKKTLNNNFFKKNNNELINYTDSFNNKKNINNSFLPLITGNKKNFTLIEQQNILNINNFEGKENQNYNKEKKDILENEINLKEREKKIIIKENELRDYI